MGPGGLAQQQSLLRPREPHIKGTNLRVLLAPLPGGLAGGGKVGVIVDVVRGTREPQSVGLPELKPLIAFGASPRASIYLAQAARAHAYLRGRSYVVPEDVKAMAYDVLRHRVLLTFEAEAEDLDSDRVVGRILEAVGVP